MNTGLAAGISPERVVEVWVGAEDGSGAVGSGYLVRGGLVLTARHLVDRAVNRTCEVRPLGTDGWMAAELAWRGAACDAALLRITETDGDEPGLVLLGRLATTARAQCQAVGFPLAQANERDQIRDTEEIVGEIVPLSSFKEGLLTVHIAGSVPLPGPSGRSPWEGMSGAALLSGALVVGVLIVDPAGFGTDRLQAVPVSAAVAEAGFREALTGDLNGAIVVRAVEDVAALRGVVSDAYRPLPVQASPQALRAGALSFLLEPEFGIVPFRGRRDELTELHGFCGGADDIRLALLIGAAGTGKSRLAAEVCNRHQADGGLAGFLHPTVPVDRFAALADVSVPLVVVIDEAQARLDQVAELVRRLARAPARAPIRLLLVARHVDEWWTHRLPELLHDDPDARFAVATAWIRTVGPLEHAGTAREQAFTDAAAAFAERMGRTFSELPLPDLSRPLFDSIFFIHLAALSALEGEAHLLAGQVVRDDLLEFALRREASYWVNSARIRGLSLDREVLQRGVAVATITVAMDEAEAAIALAAVPDLADAPQHVLRQMARWLRDLYPPQTTHLLVDQHTVEPWFRPLAPDLLGDALVARTLDDAPGVVPDLLRSASPAQAKHILTVLTQVAHSHQGAQAPLRDVLAESFESLWRTALVVAQETGDPLGRILAEALPGAPRRELVMDIFNALPTKSVALSELMVVVASQMQLALVGEVDAPYLKGQVNATDAALVEARLAAAWDNLGFPERALPSSEAVVAIYRWLVKSHSDSYLNDLAGALNNLSVRLGALRRDREALTAIEEALVIHRRLPPAERDWQAFAGALLNLFIRLETVGRNDEALSAGDEALRIFRWLAQTQPELHEPALARCLASLASSLERAGRASEALAAVEQAVEILRRLAHARPDAFGPDMADALNNLAVFLGHMGRHEEALAAVEETVAINRALAQARPDTFGVRLAISLGTYATRLTDAGRQEEAVQISAEGVAVARKLAEERPQTHLGQLAASLVTHASRLGDAGRLEQSVTVREELVATQRQLAETQPDAYLGDLAESLTVLSAGLGDLGRHREALAAGAEAIDVLRTLAQVRPEIYQTGLAAALTNLAIRLIQEDRHREALAAGQEAVARYRQLTQMRPVDSLPGLAMSLTTLSIAADKLGHHQEALQAVEESIRIYRQLARTQPDTYSNALAVALNNLSAAFAHLRRYEDALHAAEEAVAIYRSLAQTRPNAFLFNLIMSLKNLSVSLRQFGQADKAAQVLEEARRFAALYEDVPTGPWRDDPALAARFHPNHTNDLEVRFFFITQRAVEKMWVRTMSIDNEIGGYLSVLINQPYTEKTGLEMGSMVAYRVARGVAEPVWVSPVVRANLRHWSSVCRECGFDMILEPADEIMRRQFKGLPPDLILETFTTRCPACGGGMMVERRR